MKEHDIVKLLIDIPDEGLKEGDEGTIVHVYDIVHDSPSGYEVDFNGNMVCLNGHHIALSVSVEDKHLYREIRGHDEDRTTISITRDSICVALHTGRETFLLMDEVESWLRLARPHLFKESKIDPLIEGISNLDLIDSFTI